MNPHLVRAGTGDTFTFIIVAVIMLARLFGFLSKKKPGQPEKPKPVSPPRPQRQAPSTLEEFFKQLAGEPAQPPAPEPATFKRPDYLKEMEDFNRLPAEEMEEETIVESMPAPEFEPPVQPVASNDWEKVSEPEEPETQKIQALETTKQTYALLSGSHGLKMPGGNPLRLASRVGKPAIDLKDMNILKRAMLSHIIFSPPRAFDLSFDNTIM